MARALTRPAPTRPAPTRSVPSRAAAGALVLAVLLSACSPFAFVPVSNPRPAADPAPAVLPPPAAPRDRLVAAIEQSGCLLTRDNRDAILLRADLTLDELAALTRDLQAEGRVEVPPGGSGTIRLLSANCI